VNTRHVPPSRTVGIDLASQPRDTGVCTIEWSPDGGRVIQLGGGRWDDDALLELIAEPAVTKVGIDAPFGWPLAFIDATATYRDHGVWLALETNDVCFRATEALVAQEMRQPPLSVAMSNLAWPAIRCARLLTRLGADGQPLDRTGAGRVVEVYPMAALRRWGVVAAGSPSSQWAYKGDADDRRERRASHLAALMEGLDRVVALSDEHKAACEADDDDFDALISALVARAVEVGRVDPVPAGMRWLALREGWIQLPEPGSLGELL
jgi:hypothetical protein